MITLTLTEEQAKQLEWCVRNAMTPWPCEDGNDVANKLRDAGEAILQQLAAATPQLIDESSGRRRFGDRLSVGDSFWCGLESVRPTGSEQSETHVTVLGQEAFILRLQRDDGSECQVDIDDLRMVRNSLFIDPPPVVNLTIRQWLMHMRPETAEPIAAWGCKHCLITVHGARFKLMFCDLQVPWCMPANGLPGFDRQLDTIAPSIVLDTGNWPFSYALLQSGRLSLDESFTVLNARYNEQTPVDEPACDQHH